MKLTDRVSYLQGLMDGLEINDSTKEGKVLIQMADILQELALSVEDIESEVDEVVELVDTLDEDLGDLEEDFYDLDDDDDDEDYEDDDEELDSDDEFYEVICPTCGDTICLNQEMIEEGSINCPNCNELLEFDFDEETSED
mgnify:CR=1 FL=1